MHNGRRLFGRSVVLANAISNQGKLEINGYKSNLFALAESGGFAVLISPLLIFIKKIADTTYCGPLFFHVLRYLGIS